MQRVLKDLAELLQCRLSGEGETKVSGVASIKSASAGDLVFVEDEKGFAAAIASPASAIIAGESALSHRPTKPLLVSVQPKLTFARASKLLCNGESSAEGVHPTAVVHSSARIAERVTIGARVVIEEHAEIGEGTS
ncbi:MAG: LpxD N-terminal domain-containing protein, partial [Terriglobales bacterium]